MDCDGNIYIFIEIDSSQRAFKEYQQSLTSGGPLRIEVESQEYKLWCSKVCRNGFPDTFDPEVESYFWFLFPESLSVFEIGFRGLVSTHRGVQDQIESGVDKYDIPGGTMVLCENLASSVGHLPAVEFIDVMRSVFTESDSRIIADGIEALLQNLVKGYGPSNVRVVFASEKM